MKQWFNPLVWLMLLAPWPVIFVQANHRIESLEQIVKLTEQIREKDQVLLDTKADLYIIRREKDRVEAENDVLRDRLGQEPLLGAGVKIQ